MNIASTVLMSSRVYEEDDTAVFEGPLFVYSEVAQDFISYLHVIQSDHLIAYMDNNKNGKILYALKIRFATLTNIPNTNSMKYPCGFNIKTDTKRFSFYCNSQLHQNSWMSRLRRYCFLTNWQGNYTIVKQLASGKNSYVNLMEHKVTKTLVVGKVVKKELFIKHPHRLRNVKNEIAILAMIHSDLVVKFIEAYQDEKTITIVMEYLQGGMLFDRMTRKRCYSEREAAIVLKQLFESLALLHKNKIIHRDVKLENIFLVSQDDDMRIKLGDFDLASLARYIVHTKQCGTPGYMAPEVFHKQYGGYSPKTDVFSSGIVLYAMISGTFPYKAKDMEDLYERNKEGRLSMQGGLLSRLSPDCVDLLKRTLELNPKNRLTVDQALSHPYIKRYSAAVKIAPHKVLFEDEENFLADDIEEFKSTPKIPDTNMTSIRDNVSRISGISGQKLASFYKPSQNISGKSTTPRNKSSLRKSATVKDDCVTPARRSKSTLPRQLDEGEIEEEVMKETMNDGISPIQNLHTLAAPTKRFMPR